jgi:CheY-like chemotaxis protein
MGKSILVVDDDADDRDLFAEALQEIDQTIFCGFAKDGYEALDILSRPENALPDFIFLDLNMPRLSGNQFLALVKKSERLQKIPVVIFSTSVFKVEADEARLLGAILFLKKPSTFTDLVNGLREIITNKWKTLKRLG